MKKVIIALLCLCLLSGILTAALAEAVALLGEARETGMELPSGGPGERLYLGVADVPGTVQTKLYLAFMAAPNGRSIRCVTLFGQALEVPREFGDPWLINSQTKSAEDKWILMDVAEDIDLVFSQDEETAVYGLGIDDEGGHCRMVLSGHYENAGGAWTAISAPRRSWSCATSPATPPGWPSTRPRRSRPGGTA